MVLLVLRWLALLLLLVNGAYFAWGQGYLKPLGLGPASQSEPQRLAQQIHPEAIQRLSAAEFQAIQEQLQEQKKAASQTPVCWQAGPLDARQTAALRQQLTQLLPADSWQFAEQPQAGRVVREQKPGLAYLLRLPAVDAALDTKLEAVRTALAGKPLVACD